VGVPGDPADIGGAPEHVGFRLAVEDVVVGVGRLGEIAAAGVHDALGLTGGARGVQQNSGCSASNASAWCSGDAESTTSCHHTSRPCVQGTSTPVRRTTRTCSIVRLWGTAWSAASFSATGFPRR